MPFMTESAKLYDHVSHNYIVYGGQHVHLLVIGRLALSMFSILEYTNGVYVVNQGKKFWEAGGCVLYTFLTLIVSLIALTMLYVILPYVLSKEALSNFCPHHYIPYAYEMKSSYIAAKQYFFL